MFARFDENPAMTLRVIKETKRYGRTDGRTHGRTDNVKTVYPLQTKFAGGIKNFSNKMGLVCHNHWEKAFDITIRQTIKRYNRLQQLELRFVLQMEWCITCHTRAQYSETTLQCTEMK